MFKSIKSRIIFGSVMLVLIAASALSVTFYVFENNHLKDIAIDKSLKVNELQAKMIDNYFEYHINAIKELSDEVMTKDLDREAILHGLGDLYTSEYYDFFNTFYLDLEGHTETPSGEKTNASDRDFYYQMLTEDIDYLISDPIVGRARYMPSVVILVPLGSGDDLRGGVCGVLILEQLSQIAADANIGDNSYGWLCNQDGLVVAHPSEEHTMKTNLMDTDEMGYDGLEEIWIESKDRAYGHGEYYDGILKETKILTYYDIKTTPGWKLMITTIPDELYADTEHLLTYLILVTIPLTLLLAVLASFYARNMIKPVVNLTDKLNQADITETGLMENYGTSEEMTTLIKAYNQMRLSIRKHTMHLEELVAARTDELNRLNNLLKDQNDELEAQNDELFAMASTDQLTGLLNREYFHEQVFKMISRVKSGQLKSFIILFLDLDNFKYYNDTFGHDIGDKILIRVSELFSSTLRSTDIVARYGGDEFVVMLVNNDLQVGEKIKTKIQLAFKDLKGFQDEISEWSFSQVEINQAAWLGVSIGISYYDGHTSLSLDDLLKEADEHMYEDKRQRKSMQ